jgi:uncharacterized protein YyaL (SSP411 family)
MSVDDTARKILETEGPLFDTETMKEFPSPDDQQSLAKWNTEFAALQAMAKLWLMRDEIREVADDALMFAETEGFENEEALARALLAKLDAA